MARHALAGSSARRYLALALGALVLARGLPGLRILVAMGAWFIALAVFADFFADVFPV